MKFIAIIAHKLVYFLFLFFFFFLHFSFICLVAHILFSTLRSLCQMFSASSVAVSAWTLVAISLERYYAICDPLRSRRWQTLKHAYKLIALIWIASFVFMLPIAALSRLIPTSHGKLFFSRKFSPFYFSSICFMFSCVCRLLKWIHLPKQNIRENIKHADKVSIQWHRPHCCQLCLQIQFNFNVIFFNF